MAGTGQESDGKILNWVQVSSGEAPVAVQSHPWVHPYLEHGLVLPRPTPWGQTAGPVLPFMTAVPTA